MSDWKPSGFIVNTDQGPRTIAGWVKHPFALDFRVWWMDEDYESGWLLTHIPTGFQIFGVRGSLERAFEVADRVAAVGNWDFTDPEAKAPLVKPMQALMKELGEEVLRGTASLAPLYRSVSEKQAA